jgi:hypothetical protein
MSRYATRRLEGDLTVSLVSKMAHMIYSRLRSVFTCYSHNRYDGPWRSRLHVLGCDEVRSRVFHASMTGTQIHWRYDHAVMW